MATIKPDDDFNPESVAEVLRKAMKGFGTDEKKIIKALTDIDNAQRQEVAQTFKTMYGRDLIDDLKSELGGKLEHAIVSFMQTPAVYDAHTLRHAMAGAGTDEETLAEVLASRSNEQIAAIKEAYESEFDRDLEKDIMSECGGSLKRIFVSLVTGGRDESDDVDEEKATNDAKALFEAGEGAWGTDESEFNRVFMTSSAAQLRATCDKYREISDYDLSRAIRKEMSGDLEFAFLAVLECARNPPVFFAERAFRAMDGMGTDERELVRAIVSRAEIDLEQVKEAFIDKYEKKLSKMVKDDVGGDFEKFLLAVIKD